MKSIINWKELQAIASQRPPQPEKNTKKPEVNMWDNIATFYNKMNKMEREYTLKQLKYIDISPEDTVLDVCCGAGRLSVPIAKIAKHVTGLDSSKEMLKYFKQNVEEAGLDNVDTIFMDWNDVVPGENVQKHDIVIASRNGAIQDFEKLSALANKYVVVLCWANAPSIPEITGYLFEGTGLDNKVHFNKDRRLGYNVMFNMLYDLGYDANINVVDDGYTQTYNSREEAYEDLRNLKPEMSDDKMDIFKKNVDKFLTENEDGTVTYLCKTKTYVLGWKPEIQELGW
ncbi:MAG: class I SAM-dependent methyltransferase [Intestinibacter sp.]|uniref:class I SAM-dependent methyltransferase n=1 Tax=Intestinibacter sp. TaxID=1965304 RepID=UPI003F13E2DA